MPHVTPRHAVVTGAGSGIGRAVAERLARDGFAVSCLDIDATAAADVAASIEEAGAHAHAVQVDVTDEPSMRSAVASAVDSLGPITFLCASAGIQLFGQDAPCSELELDVWQRTLAVNATGYFLACKTVLPELVRSRGSIVLIGSPTGSYGVAPGFTAYSASKSTSIGLARVIAADYASAGVRANVVIPGFTRTPLVGSIFDSDDAKAAEMRRIPLGRPGEPGDVAGLVAFLASDDASFCTGAIYTADGGSTAV